MEKASQSAKKRYNFSFKRGLLFFLTCNIVIVGFVVLFLLNRNSWGDDGITFVLTFVFFFEVFLMLLSFIACLKQDNQPVKSRTDGKDSMNKWIGIGLTLIILSLFSLIFKGAGLSYPSTLIFLVLVTNWMFALYSIIFHPVAIMLYQANVYTKRTSISDYAFKYAAIFLSGINYHVQLTLQKAPLIVNKVIALVFAALLIWQVFMVIAIFD